MLDVVELEKGEESMRRDLHLFERAAFSAALECLFFCGELVKVVERDKEASSLELACLLMVVPDNMLLNSFVVVVVDVVCVCV